MDMSTNTETIDPTVALVTDSARDFALPEAFDVPKVRGFVENARLNGWDLRSDSERDFTVVATAPDIDDLSADAIALYSARFYRADGKVYFDSASWLTKRAIEQRPEATRGYNSTMTLKSVKNALITGSPRSRMVTAQTQAAREARIAEAKAAPLEMTNLDRRVIAVVGDYRSRIDAYEARAETRDPLEKGAMLTEVASARQIIKSLETLTGGTLVTSVDEDGYLERGSWGNTEAGFRLMTPTEGFVTVAAALVADVIEHGRRGSMSTSTVTNFKRDLWAGEFASFLASYGTVIAEARKAVGVDRDAPIGGRLF